MDNSRSNMEDMKEISDETPKKQVDNTKIIEDEKDSDHNTPSSKLEEDAIKKKYGGLLSKKHPLISKDHERAFFDSADWALGKQKGQKPKGPLEALRPKLQPTPHQQLRTRRLAYASDDNTEESEDDKNVNLDDKSCSSTLKDDGLNENSKESDFKSHSEAEHREVS